MIIILSIINAVQYYTYIGTGYLDHIGSTWTPLTG